jgi:hypothetical protein
MCSIVAMQRSREGTCVAWQRPVNTSNVSLIRFKYTQRSEATYASVYIWQETDHSYAARKIKLRRFGNYLCQFHMEGEVPCSLRSAVNRLNIYGISEMCMSESSYKAKVTRFRRPRVCELSYRRKGDQLWGNSDEAVPCY